MSRHAGVRCDACSLADFPGKRYKCLICYDYDLCETCYEHGATDATHNVDHAVQCLLTPADYDLYYGGEVVEMPHSFTCPMCATRGFTLDGLRQHLKSEHKNTEMQVVCPVCAVTTGGNPNIMTRDLEVHLALEHVRDIDILDGQSASRQLQKIPPTSLRSTMGSSARERLLQRHLPTAVSALPLSPTDMNSVTLAGLLSQMSTEAGRTPRREAPGGTATKMQHVGMGLPVSQKQVQTPFNQQGRPRHHNPFAAGTSAHSLPSARLPPPVAVRTKSTLVKPPAFHDPRYLLNGIVQQSSDTQQQELEVECSNRSLFVQELLLSTLEAQALARAEGQRWVSEPPFLVEKALWTGTVPSGTTILEKTTITKSVPSPTTSLGEVFSTIAELTLVATQAPTATRSSELTLAASTGMSATASTKLTSSVIPGLASGTNPSMTVRNSAGPTSTMSSGSTADAKQTSIAANSNKLKVLNGGSPVTPSPGATAATTRGPIEATTVETTLETVPDATASIHPYPAPPSTH